MNGDALKLNKEEFDEEVSDSDDFGADRDTEFARKMDTVIKHRIEDNFDEKGEVKDAWTKDEDDEKESSGWMSGCDIGAMMVEDIKNFDPTPLENLPNPASLFQKDQLAQENALR